MQGSDQAVLPHHLQAAEMWGLGGREYDNVSFAISDALGHAAQRLAPQPGDQVLDVATGTGWTARNAARTGAKVTGIDIAERLLKAAQDLSAHMEPPITFLQADAERLPFPDASFDRVISTFGVMFATNQEQAAAELARVCRPGGRLVVASWTPDSSVKEFFAITARHLDAPPPEASPFAWGDPEALERLLGDGFELVFEEGENHAYHDDEDAIWNWYARGFGPIRQAMKVLDPQGLAAFRRDIDAYHRHYATPAGLRVRRGYLLAIGTRRG